jgi:chemotaxis protein CheD
MPLGAEIMVRMGELAVSKAAGDVLVTIGLGSCVGLALVDRRRSLAGLAHVMLPSTSDAQASSPAKFADQAVPALLERLHKLGAVPSQLEAVLVGGAQMFTLSGGSGLDIGGRNERAVREALTKLGIPVRAAETGGSSGRTIRVHVNTGTVLAKAAGGREVELLAGIKA